MNSNNDQKNFLSSPILFVDKENTNQKILSIPINKIIAPYNSEIVSKSWNGYTEKIKNNKKNYSSSPTNDYIFAKKYNRNNRTDNDMFLDEIRNFNFKPYDAIVNCKSAGIIPYAIHNNTIYFLFQQITNPIRKKDSGWNDFGGKRISLAESTIETAAREFSEETSCLFYLHEQNNEESKKTYHLLKDNKDLHYDTQTVEILKKLISISQKYYVERINEFVSPIYISSKETYISYFVRVDYIPDHDLPRAEDIHIPYENRYIRTCKWYSIDELLKLDEKDFHKRLQITRIQQRINNYHRKGLFI